MRNFKNLRAIIHYSHILHWYRRYEEERGNYVGNFLSFLMLSDTLFSPNFRFGGMKHNVVVTTKTSYVSNFALSFYCMNGSIEGRCTNYENSSVCNSDFLAKSVLLEFFKVMCLPSIDPFM